MRIGRDHIASTVYTIAFATAGASLPVLLLIAIYNRPLFQVLQSEQFAAEIVRTMVGSIGLIMAVPLTTAVGVAVVRASRTGKLALGSRPKQAVADAGAGRGKTGSGDEGSGDGTPDDPVLADPAAATGGDEDETTVLPKQRTRLRRRPKTQDDYGFSEPWMVCDFAFTRPGQRTRNGTLIDSV